MSDPFTELCLEVEKVINAAYELKKNSSFNARKLSIVITKLEEAKLWLLDSIKFRTEE